MRRREFTSLLGSAVAVWPLAVRAQQPEHIRRIGVLMGYAESGSSGQSLIAAFRDGLQKLGWTEGRNTRIDIRWAAPDDMESIRRFAKELITLQPDLIISSTTPITAALQQQTRPSRSFFRRFPILSAAVWWRASRDLAAISLVSTFRSRRKLASGWSCSRRLRRMLPGSRCCSTQHRRHMPSTG